MSLKLSVRYNQNNRLPTQSDKVTDTESPVLYLMAGMIPENLGRISTQTSAFRDSLLGNILDCPDKEAVLATFVQFINATEKITEEWEVSYCEYAATIAYALNDIDLFKEILLRVEPKSASSMLHALYSAVVVNKTITPESYVSVVRQSSAIARVTWESQKRFVGL